MASPARLGPGLLLASLLTWWGCSAEPSARTLDRQAPSLGGRSWQLVKFEGSDGHILTPDDRAKYTISFDTTGVVAVRIDCNRGRGSWASPGPSQLQLGTLALTRAMCPPGSLHNQIVKQWTYVRSYTLKGGHLYLSLMADGGVYEFEPLVKAGNQ